jgi:competence/damage-inducible protein CinA-like protein
MKAEIITIGDELLIGQVVNTNQAFIAEKLNGIGIEIDRMTTVGDQPASVLDAFRWAWERQDVVIVTGGLGPTHDDITKKAVCSFFETDLVSDAQVREHIVHLLQTRNIAWTPSAEEQTMVPRTSTVIPNPVGTAPGMLFEHQQRRFIVLPGVPYEMTEMMVRTVIPLLASHVEGSVIRHRTLRTSGIAESILARQLGNIDDILGGARLAFLPSPTGVRLRIDVHGLDERSAMTAIAEVEKRILDKVGKYVYGTEDEELEDVIGRLLTERRLTLAVAESCTGGMIADRVTNVSGSSAYFERGIVAYSNTAKTELLGVPKELIQQHGAVSREVAEAMAAGIRKIANTDVAISTTGIAGPTGGTPEKPVGLVWIGYADATENLALRFNFGDNRHRTKERASTAALELIRRRLLRVS